MTEATGFIVRKNEKGKPLWLMHNRPCQLQELEEGVGLKGLITCIWGNNRRDAKIFTCKREATRIAKESGNAYVEPVTKEA